MKAVVIEAGEKLVLRDHPDPEPGPRDLLVRVHAAGVNRADLAQRAGRYPPPPGASEVLGLECAGVVESVGPEAGRWKPGDRVCALLAGGGYAELAACPERHVLPIPEGLSFAEAAGLPETVATARLNIFREAAARPGELLLLHAGASGVGTTAIQLAREAGVRAWVTVGSRDKLDLCRSLGAEGGSVRHDEAFAERVAGWTGGRGFDVILDPVGAAYLEDNQRALAVDGRLVLIGLLGGRTAPIDLGRLLTGRQRLIGSTLRSRSDAFKAELIADIEHEVWPLVARGRVRPVIDAVLAIAEADEAHRRLASNRTAGKIILEVRR